MKEIDDLSSGIEKLKRNSDSQKRLVEALEKDRAFLMERTRFLGQKLSEAYVIYEEAGKRILDFVDRETAPVKNQIDELKAEIKKLSAIEQELKLQSSYIAKMRTGEDGLKARITDAEKSLKKLDGIAALSRSQIDQLRERESKDDEILEARLTEIKNHFESRLKTAEEKLSAKVTEASEEVLQDATDAVHALAASHEDVRKRLSDTGLFVRQLRVNVASLKKQMQSAGFSRQEIEKRLSGQQSSIKELDSSTGKLERRLDSISLEDEKLERRLTILRKNAEESTDSKISQFKTHLDASQKRQIDLLENRLKAIGELERKISEVRKESEEAISSKGVQLKTHLDASQKRQLELLETRLRALSDDFAVRISRMDEKLAVEKESLISRMEKQHAAFGKLAEDQRLRYDAAKLEMEKRTATARKEMEEAVASKTGQMKTHLEMSQEKQSDFLENRLASFSDDFGEKLSKLSERISTEKVEMADIESMMNEKIRDSEKSAGLMKSELEKILSSHQSSIRGLDSSMTRMVKRMDSISLEDDKLEKRLADLRKKSEDSTDSKIGRLRTQVEQADRRQLKLLENKVKGLSDNFEGNLSRINERLAGERADMQHVDGLIAERIKDVHKAASLRESSLRKEIIDSRRRTEESVDERFGKIREHLELSHKKSQESVDSRFEAIKSHVSLTNQKQLELIGNKLKALVEFDNRLSEIRKESEESISSKGVQLKTHLDASQKRQLELLETRLRNLSEGFEGKLSRINEKLAGERADMQNVEALISERIKEAHKAASVREAGLHNEIAGLRKHLLSGQSSLASRIEKQDTRFEGLVKQQSMHADSIKGELQKHLSEVRKVTEESIHSKVSQLKAHVDGSQKRHLELLDTKLRNLSEGFEGKLSRINEKLAGERADMQNVEALISERIKEVHKAASVREGTLQREIVDSKRKTEESVDSRFEKIKSYLELANQRQAELLENKLKALVEFEKRISEIRKDAELAIGSRAGQLKAHVDASQKKHAELLEARLRNLSENFEGKVSRINERLVAEKADMQNVEALISERIKEAQKVASVRESKLEKNLIVAKKKAEETIEAKFERIKSHIDLSDQRQAELLENKLKALAEFDIRLSGIKKETGEVMDSKFGKIKSSLELAGQKQAEILESKLKAVAEFEKKLSVQNASIKQLNSSLGIVGRKLNSVSLDDEKLEKRLAQVKNASHEEIASKVSGLNDLVENKLSQVYSHVASEKKALAETRAVLEKDIRTEQKALLSRLNIISEKSEKKAAQLSGDISSEKKSLSEERVKFSQSMRSAAQAIARIDQFSKSLENRLKKSEDDASATMKLIESRVYEAIEKSHTASSEKADTLYGSISTRLAKLETGVYSEKDDFSKRLKSTERGSKSLSIALSTLNRQLRAVASEKASSKKKSSDSELVIKKLASSLASIDSSSRTATESLRKQIALLESRNADLTGQLKKTQELVHNVLENSAASGQKSASAAAGQEEMRKKVAVLESAARVLSERASQNEKLLAARISQVEESEKSRKAAEADELKAYVASLVKLAKEPERIEIVKMRSELLNLRKEISQWNEEQAKLYELLKEED